MNSPKYASAEELIQRMIEGKKRATESQNRLTFEEKLRLLVRLQEKAYFWGKTKFRPWPLP